MDKDKEDRFGLKAMDAIENEDLTKVKYWLRAGVRICEIYSNGRTLLGVAANCGDLETFKLLLDIQEFNAIAQNADFEADVLHKDAFDREIFNYAFACGQSDILKYLLDRFPSLFNPNTHHSYSSNLLDHSVQYGFKDTVTVLLEKGANINELNHNNQTALIVAAQLGKVEILQMLIERGARLNIVDKFNYSALCYAVSLKQEKACKLLIEAGIDYDLGRVDRYYRVIEKAFWNKMTETVALLFKHHARFQDYTCYLHVAVTVYQDLEIVKLLLKAGADINCLDYKRATPLYASLRINGENHEITKYLIEVGALVGATEFY